MSLKRLLQSALLLSPVLYVADFSLGTFDKLSIGRLGFSEIRLVSIFLLYRTTTLIWLIIARLVILHNCIFCLVFNQIPFASGAIFFQS